MIGLDPHFFSTHSLRRTKAALIAPARRAAAIRAYQDREHGQVSRYRSGRCSRDSRTGRRPNCWGKADQLCPSLTVAVVPKADLFDSTPNRRGRPRGSLTASTAQAFKFECRSHRQAHGVSPVITRTVCKADGVKARAPRQNVCDYWSEGIIAGDEHHHMIGDLGRAAARVREKRRMFSAVTA